MDHTPFIVAAYGFSAVVFSWVALAPVLQTRRFEREWLLRLRGRETVSQANPSRGD